MENACYPRISGKIIDVRDRKLLVSVYAISIKIIFFDTLTFYETEAS